MSVSVEAVVEAVCSYASDSRRVEPRLVLASTRGGPAVARARFTAMWVWASVNGVTNKSEIGRAFGRERATAFHALERVRETMDREPPFAWLLGQLVDELREP
jgi:hypothetical protein